MAAFKPREPRTNPERGRPASSGKTAGPKALESVFGALALIGNRETQRLLAVRSDARTSGAALSVARVPPVRTGAFASNDPLEQQADAIAERVATFFEAGPNRPRTDERQESPGALGNFHDPQLARTRGQALPPELGWSMQEAFGADFSNVRVHADARADRLNRALGSRAFTVGQDIFFRRGRYPPAGRAGRKLLAHELVHTLQQRGSTPPRIQCSFCEEDVREDATFDSLFGSVVACEAQGDVAIMARLMPPLLERVREQDLLDHGHELIRVMTRLGMIPRLVALMPRFESAWRGAVAPRSGGGPTPGVGGATAPRLLIDLARDLASRDQHARALALLRAAFLSLQVLAAGESDRLGDALGDDDVAPARRRISSVIALGWGYHHLAGIYAQMREVVGLYPELARERYAAGDPVHGDELIQVGSVLAFQLREMGGLLPDTEATRGLTMATLPVTRPDGGPAYEAWGAQGTREVLNPLPGAPSADELAGTLGLWQPMQQILDVLYGQEAWLAGLYRHPEIVQEFGNHRIDVHDADQRLRLFRRMHQIFQRDGVGVTPLDGILRFMEEYLRRFSFHAGDYNIRDSGPNYLDTDFPRDLTGRVLRDCGVYAVTVAYDLHRLARAENIDVEFSVFTSTDHALLLITETAQNAHFLLSNDEIEGPLFGNEIGNIAVAFSETAGRDYVALPSITQPLGSTTDPDALFRRRIWARYQNTTRWGLLPEPPGPGDTRTEQERVDASYQSYYRAREELDGLAGRVDSAVRALSRALAESDAPLRTIEPYIEPLSVAGARLADIFIRYASEARLAIGAAPGADTSAWMLYGLYATPTRLPHPLVRLARVLLYYQHLGGNLDARQHALTSWMCAPRSSAPGSPVVLREQEFCNLVQLYVQLGFPPDFDMQ